MRKSRIKYEDYGKMIYHMAWRMNQMARLRFDVEELRSEGNVIFVQAVNNYRPSMGITFSTYLTRCLRNGLTNYIRANMKWIHDQLDPVLDYPHTIQENIERQINLRQTINSLSETAQYMIAVLLDDPMKSLHLAGDEPPRRIRGALFQHVIDQGYTHMAAWASMREIKQAFMNV